MEYVSLFLCCGVILYITYHKGRIDAEIKAAKTTRNVFDFFERRIQTLKDEIEEIKNRSENWKNKIAEAKETFKDA